jgi:hypothetical protein
VRLYDRFTSIGAVRSALPGYLLDAHSLELESTQRTDPVMHQKLIDLQNDFFAGPRLALDEMIRDERAREVVTHEHAPLTSLLAR